MLNHLRSADGKWTVRDDVWVRSQRERGPLLARPLEATFSVYGDSHQVEPEFQFGHMVGDELTHQALAIKTAPGGKYLNVDCRPPRSGGQVGPNTTNMMHDIREGLARLEKEFPVYDGSGYELADFVWYHGRNGKYDGEVTTPASFHFAV